MFSICTNLNFNIRFSVKHDNGEFIEEDCQIRIDYFKTEDERREAMNLMNFEIESGKN